MYEYMPNGSLDQFIFGNNHSTRCCVDRFWGVWLILFDFADRQRQPLLGWEKRLRIIGGVADGLLYLHKHSRVRVIHWDLKSSNILLDKELSPKISDFGLAKIFRPNTLEGNSKRVVGTL